MHFNRPLLQGRLVRRYKRFLADVELSDGTRVTAHTPNTGSMAGCAEPGSRVWLSESVNPKRKYPLSWELVQTGSGTLVGINTALANLLAHEAITNGVIRELQGYDAIRAEVRYGWENSRIDLLLEQRASARRCYVEVKNVTLLDGPGRALFPDAVTVRGTRHLRELTEVVRQGQRAVMLYCVQREDAKLLAPADAIDRAYGDALRAAVDQGVEALAYRATVTPQRIALDTALSVDLD